MTTRVRTSLVGAAGVLALSAACAGFWAGGGSARALVRVGLGLSLSAFAVAAVLDLAEHLRLERAATGRWWSWQAIPPGETCLHAGLAVVFASFLFLARPLSAELEPRDGLTLVAPLLFLALGACDELLYHRRRSEHREHILHTTSHLAAGACLAFIVLDRVVPWA